MRTLLIIALLSLTLGCVTNQRVIRKAPEREVAGTQERPLFAELVLPGLQAEGINMGAAEHELVRAEQSVFLTGDLNCVERARVGDEVRVRLGAKLKWTDPAGKSLGSLQKGHEGQGADFDSACETLMNKHGKSVSAQVVARTVKAFDSLK